MNKAEIYDRFLAEYRSCEFRGLYCIWLDLVILSRRTYRISSSETNISGEIVPRRSESSSLDSIEIEERNEVAQRDVFPPTTVILSSLLNLIGKI